MSIFLLACIGLIAGIGITAVGPGGVLATIGLFLFTGYRRQLSLARPW